MDLPLLEISIHQLMGNVAYFHLLDIMNNAIINTHGHLSISLGCVSGSRIAGSNGNFKFLRNCQTLSQNVYTILPLHWQRMRGPISPHPSPLVL